MTLERSVARDGSWTPLVFPYISEPARRMLVPFDRNGRPLEWPLVIYFCLDDYATEHNPNKAVRAFVEGSFPDAEWWSGPMVVLKATNCDIRDFRDVGNGAQMMSRMYGVSLAMRCCSSRPGRGWLSENVVSTVFRTRTACRNMIRHEGRTDEDTSLY